MVFGGSKGATLKPFVPTQKLATKKPTNELHETGMQKQEKFDFMANDLDLTEEQKEEFRKREEELDQAWYNEEINQNDLFDSYEQ